MLSIDIYLSLTTSISLMNKLSGSINGRVSETTHLALLATLILLSSSNTLLGMLSMWL